MAEGLTDIGEKNTEFAELYLKRERIPLLGGSTRGREARRIQFWPVSGRVRQLALNIKLEAVTKLQPQSANDLPRAHGSVELF